jgi:hypothetical protein
MRLRRNVVLTAVAALGLGAVVARTHAEIQPPALEAGWQQVNLLGMVLRQVGGSFAIIQDPVTGKTEFYPLGADVKGARLDRILSDRIVLTRGGTRLVLRLGVAGGRSSEGTEETGSASSNERRQPGGARGRSSALTSGGEASEPRSAPPGGGSAGRDKSDSGDSATPAGGGSGESGVTATGGPSAQLRISGLHHDGVIKQQNQFAAADLRDLHLDVDYSQISGEHRQRIELFGPDGTLYQRRFRDVTVTPGQPVNTRVPVGGTWITDHSLFGNWRVVVYLDTNQTPIASGAFALNP